MRKKDIREHRRERAIQRQHQQTLTSWFGLFGGFLVLAGAWFFLAGNNPERATLDFTPADIVTQDPWIAVHEMSGPMLDMIPFLPKGQPQPKIAISETRFNFGAIGATEVVSHDFVIQNIGEAPLTISRAYTTCGCTTAEFSASVVPPGKVVIMTLIFDAGFHDARGQTVRRGVIIENNDPNLPQLEIWTTASIGSD